MAQEYQSHRKDKALEDPLRFVFTKVSFVSFICFHLNYFPFFLYLTPEHDEMRFGSERQNSSGSAFAAGLVNGAIGSPNIRVFVF